MHGGMSSVWGQTGSRQHPCRTRLRAHRSTLACRHVGRYGQRQHSTRYHRNAPHARRQFAVRRNVDGHHSNRIGFHCHRPEKRFIPNPQRALWLSLIIPGAGQIYNRKLWKIPIVYGGFLGCLYALTWNNQMYGDYSQAYLDIMDDDPNTKSYENMLPLNYSIAGREDQYKEIFKNKKNYYRKYRDMSIFAMIAVYLLSVVDAYVDAELSSFDISKDLGLRIEPAVFNFGGRGREASVGVQCNLNF